MYIPEPIQPQDETVSKPHQNKKALIIGIVYESSPDGELRGPHRDAMDFKNLLISHYGYREEDIVVMRDLPDGNGESRLQPTKDNILREIENLVKDVQSGDQLVFMYAGHSSQVPTGVQDGYDSEEDGMNEDYTATHDPTKLVIDDELRKCLVEGLPIGSRLTGIFDSCHSGTLLDLEHYKCNRGTREIASKGARPYRTKWMGVERRDTELYYPHGLRIHSRRRTSSQDIESTDVSVQILPSVDSRRKTLSIKTRTSTSNSNRTNSDREERTESIQTHPITPDEETVCVTSDDMSNSQLCMVEEAEKCTSPVSTHCDGFCPWEEPTTATVVSISACADDQLSWENRTGESMTQALIGILRNDPHPTLASLMDQLGDRLYQSTMDMLSNYTKKRRWNQQYGPAKRIVGANGGVARSGVDLLSEPEIVNFYQTPQMGSRCRLNMAQCFTL